MRFIIMEWNNLIKILLVWNNFMCANLFLLCIASFLFRNMNFQLGVTFSSLFSTICFFSFSFLLYSLTYMTLLILLILECILPSSHWCLLFPKLTCPSYIMTHIKSYFVLAFSSPAMHVFLCLSILCPYVFPCLCCLLFVLLFVKLGVSWLFSFLMPSTLPQLNVFLRTLRVTTAPQSLIYWFIA